MISRILINDKVPLSNIFLLSPNQAWVSLEMAVVTCGRGLWHSGHLGEGSKTPYASGCPDLSSAKMMFSQVTRVIAGEGSSQEPENLPFSFITHPRSHVLQMLL